eukprot:3643471-Heterocapsa_arctica.AAC.1
MKSGLGGDRIRMRSVCFLMFRNLTIERSISGLGGLVRPSSKDARLIPLRHASLSYAIRLRGDHTNATVGTRDSLSSCSSIGAIRIT